MRILGVLISLLLVVTGCQTVSDEDIRDKVTEVATSPLQPSSFTPAIEAQVRRQFVTVLKDPESLRFQGVNVGTTTLRTGERTVFICGLFNSKNSFGGYAGYTPFMAEVINGEPAGLSINERVATRACTAIGMAPIP